MKIPTRKGELMYIVVPTTKRGNSSHVYVFKKRPLNNHVTVLHVNNMLTTTV